MVDGNNGVQVIPEGGVPEACRAPLARLRPGEHSQRWVIGTSLLGHGVVTGAIKVILLVVKGEDVQVSIEEAVSAWEGKGNI